MLIKREDCKDEEEYQSLLAKERKYLPNTPSDYAYHQKTNGSNHKTKKIYWPDESVETLRYYEKPSFTPITPEERARRRKEVDDNEREMQAYLKSWTPEKVEIVKNELKKVRKMYLIWHRVMI